VSLKYSIRINGIEKLAVTKLDVLDQFDEIKVCTGYTLDGKKLDRFPSDLTSLETVEPAYRTFPGWKTTTSDIRRYRDLPPKARKYIEAIASLSDAEIWMISIGARRDQTIWFR